MWRYTIPHRYYFFSHLIWTPSAEGQLKNSGQRSFHSSILYVFCFIALLKCKASISRQGNFNLELIEDRAPPEKLSHTTHELARNVFSRSIIIQRNTISLFDTDSVPLCIDSCDTQGLTRFK